MAKVYIIHNNSFTYSRKRPNPLMEGVPPRPPPLLTTHYYFTFHSKPTLQPYWNFWTWVELITSPEQFCVKRFLFFTLVERLCFLPELSLGDFLDSVVILGATWALLFIVGLVLSFWVQCQTLDKFVEFLRQIIPFFKKNWGLILHFSSVLPPPKKKITMVFT